VAFTDTFTVAVNTNLESHTPSGGTAWTLAGGVAGAAIAQGTYNHCRPRTTTLSYYTCDDQGSADHYTQATLDSLTSFVQNAYVAVRLVNSSNFIGWRCYGVGSSGLRLTEVIGGVAADKKTFQGIAGHIYKVEASGSTAKLYDNGVEVTGSAFSIDAALSGETSQGLVIASEASVGWINVFEAGALGGGGAVNLEGNAAAQATAAATASVAVPLAGAGITVATTTGAVSVSIDPSGDAKAQANSTGGLSVSVPFTAAALVSALAAAGLSIDKPLSGSGAGEAGSAATISLNVSLAGSPVAEAVATGSLGVVGDGLTGAAVVSPSALGNVSLAVGLSGASLAVSDGIGNLTQLVPLLTSAASASLATGGLDIAVNLNAAALVEALAAATLSVASSGADLAGNADAEATATGTITLRVNLEGNAVAQAIAAGALTASGLIVAGTPGWSVSSPARNWSVSSPARNWSVSSPARNWSIAS